MKRCSIDSGYSEILLRLGEEVDPPANCPSTPDRPFSGVVALPSELVRRAIGRDGGGTLRSTSNVPRDSPSTISQLVFDVEELATLEARDPAPFLPNFNARAHRLPVETGLEGEGILEFVRDRSRFVGFEVESRLFSESPR